MSLIKLKPMSSLETCFLDENIDEKTKTDSFTVLKGQKFCCQVAMQLDDSTSEKVFLPVKISGDLAEFVTVRNVVSVPVHFPAYPSENPDAYLRMTPGLYPDLLSPLHYDGQVILLRGQTQVLWLTADFPESVPAGEYSVTVSVGEDSATVKVRILSMKLPDESFIHTEWFYTDCLADYYHVKPFSEEHWKIVANYIETAVKNGINMILTPIFTPELDTYIGGERTTTQLVKIKVLTEGKYEFDFAPLNRWIDLCKSLGVQYFEIPHLFSQWGANATPKFVADVDGEEKKIFGWETDSLGKEYDNFLSQFLPALLEVLKAKNVLGKTYFHVSDEPHLDHLEHYTACKKMIEKYLGDLPIIDALSDYAFYETGAIKKPVPGIKHIDPFLEHQVPNLWAYYCGSTTGKSHTTGRMIAQRLCDTRAIGFQMWQFKIEGFLHWGYNFWNTQNSYDNVNPYLRTDGDYFVPSGDTMLVYPDADGHALESTRLNAMREAVEDYKLLTLCERKHGRAYTEQLLETLAGEKITFRTLPPKEFYAKLYRAVADVCE